MATPAPVQLSQIPEVRADQSFTWEKFMSIYTRTQVILVKNVVQRDGGAPFWGLTDLNAILSQDEASVNATWTVENRGSASALSPRDVLSSDGEQGHWYASFIIQSDSPRVKATVESLPVVVPSFLKGVTHSPCSWFFFGRNVPGTGAAPMRGKPFHVDAVRNDGTWHLQTSGTKTWRLKPNVHADWPTAGGPPGIPGDSLSVSVECGDILAVNTRLWFHETEVKPQPHPCVSYARDFFLLGRHSLGNAASTETKNPASGTAELDFKSPPRGALPSGLHMANRHGTWATSDVAPGKVILVEAASDVCPSADAEPSRTGPRIWCAACGRFRAFAVLGADGKAASQRDGKRRPTARAPFPPIPGLLDFPHRGRAPARVCSEACGRADSQKRGDLFDAVDPWGIVNREPACRGVTSEIKSTLVFAARVAVRCGVLPTRRGGRPMPSTRGSAALEEVCDLSESGKDFWDMITIERGGHVGDGTAKQLRNAALSFWSAVVARMCASDVAAGARRDAIGWDAFRRVLAAVYEKAMDIDDECLPSPAEEYASAAAELVAEANDAPDQDRRVAQARDAASVLTTWFVRLRTMPPAPRDAEGVLELLESCLSEFTIGESAQTGPGAHWQGMALFPRMSRVRTAESGETPNCGVVFEESRPVARLVAVRDIRAGDELLTEADGGEDAESDDPSHDGNDAVQETASGAHTRSGGPSERLLSDDGPPTKRART